jgi:hypothetical protein
MEMLRRKMEGLSNGSLLERMEDEYGSMLSTASSSATNSASTSKRKEFPDMPSSSTRQPCKVKFHDITQKGNSSVLFLLSKPSTVKVKFLIKLFSCF